MFDCLNFPNVLLCPAMIGRETIMLHLPPLLSLDLPQLELWAYCLINPDLSLPHCLSCTHYAYTT